MTKYVIGEYASIGETQTRVNELLDQGYPPESIKLISNEDVVEQLDDAGVAVETDLKDIDDESLWDRVKDFFGAGDHEDHLHSILDAHREDIEGGNILIVADDELVPDSLRGQVADEDTGYWDNNCNCDRDLSDIDTNVSLDDDDTIRLQRERLNVDKDSVRAGDVTISTHVVEENQTIDVPVRHDEVVVERVPVTDYRTADGDFEDETITIPLNEERVNVSKEAVVSEEVHVSKRQVEETESFNESLRREELDVEKEGDVIVTGSRQ